jgi:hypothetical protein
MKTCPGDGPQQRKAVPMRLVLVTVSTGSHASGQMRELSILE